MLYLEIDDDSPVPIYEQIVDGIQRFVRQEKLAPGVSLPSVRQLASDLDINPNTVAKAYGLLEREGILETARRRGTRVSEGALTHARHSLTARAEAAADRMVRETAHLELDPEDLVSALMKRLGISNIKRRSS